MPATFSVDELVLLVAATAGVLVHLYKLWLSTGDWLAAMTTPARTPAEVEHYKERLVVAWRSVRAEGSLVLLLAALALAALWFGSVPPFSVQPGAWAAWLPYPVGLLAILAIVVMLTGLAAIWWRAWWFRQQKEE